MKSSNGAPAPPERALSQCFVIHALTSEPDKLRVLFACALASVAIAKLTSVSYANSFTGGITRMFFLIVITMFITALVLYVEMRRGLRASLAVPLAASAAAPPEEAH
jgi:hypothetical protein